MNRKYQQLQINDRAGRLLILDQGLERFYTDVGPRPTPKHQIERVDNNKGYSPDNCKWATKSEQMLNRRARTATINGQSYLVREIARIAGTGINTVHRRLNRGIADERLFSPKRILDSRNAAQSKPESMEPTTTNTKSKGA